MGAYGEWAGIDHPAAAAVELERISTKKAGATPARLPRLSEKKLVRFQPTPKGWIRVVPEGMTPRKDEAITERERCKWQAVIAQGG